MKNRNKIAVGAAAALVAGGVGAEIGHALTPNHTTVHTTVANPNQLQSDQGAQYIANDLALGHEVQVVEQGKAVVKMNNGSRIVITNPIVEDMWSPKGEFVGEVVAERTRGSDQGENTPVTAYFPGENGVKSVDVEKDGKTLNFNDDVTRNNSVNTLNLSREQGLSGEGYGTGPDSNGDIAGYFKPVENQVSQPMDPKEKIAQGAEFDA
jgi:hypothetical protein